MKFISHRGNIFGPNPDHDNNPTWIKYLLSSGITVEVDIWYDKKTSNYFLGNKEPIHKFYPIDYQHRFNQIIFDCKTVETYLRLQDFYTTGVYSRPDCIFHQSEKVVHSTSGRLWFFPQYIPDFTSNKCDDAVLVVPDKNKVPYTWRGYVCSDYIDPKMWMQEVV